MPVQNLNFQGINRAISDYGNAGACEELINLRPTTGGLVPVKQFADKYNGTLISCGKIFVHKADSANNYLTLTHSQGESHTHIYTISLLNNDGTRTSIDEVTFGTRAPSIDDVHFAFAGNIVMFSFFDSRYKRTFKNLSYLWDGTQYKKQVADIPAFNATISPKEHADSSLDGAQVLTYDGVTLESSATKNEIIDAINVSLNAIQEQNPSYSLGPVIVALVLKTKDGSQLATVKWMMYDPIADFKSTSIFHQTSPAPEWADFFAAHPEGGFITVGAGHYYQAAGEELTVKIGRIADFDNSHSIISSVEIYASRPKLYIVPSFEYGQDVNVGQVKTVMMPYLKLNDMGLEKQLLYFQKSIPIKNLTSLGADETYDVDLVFGGNIQMTNKTLDVDAGNLTRYGNLLAYNDRFHFYDSIAKTIINMPDFHYTLASGESTETKYIAAVYNDGKKDTVVYLGTKDLPERSMVELIIADSIRVKRIYVQAGLTADNSADIYELTPSAAYNYSIYCNPGDSVSTRMGIPIDTTITSAITEEPDAINVTEQYNPFVFRVEHSYLAPGKVLDIQPQMVAVADVSYGDYPLNVFTNRGLYALLQGNGTVLYGAFRPVSNLITTANSVPTEFGTFFLASGSLWVISGSKAVLISDALSLGPHKYIRDCDEYLEILAAEDNEESAQSQVSFEDYVNGATLAYNRFRDELFVSNTEYNYCYVLSLKYRQWFKMTLKVVQDVVGDSILKEPVNVFGTIVWKVLDLSDEIEDGTNIVHLQSRPFSMGYQYSHIHRIVSMIRADLTDGMLIVSLYGSDNLQDWNLLSYASRAGIKISQIRTPSAARSWRYYTLCIGGTCPSDTDFGTTLFEYQPVIRRLG